MANYLMKYKGKYRLKTPIDLTSKTFPREYTGQFAENDIYIDCQNKIQIFYFGKGILEVYIPSIGRGRNIIKAIEEAFQGENIIFNIEESESEVLFKFHSKYMEQLAPYLKPKTSGANISPFSSRNLPRNKNYIIPDEDLMLYKEIVQKIDKKRIIELTHMTNNYLKSLVNKRNKWDNIKADMALKGLKGKEYIHSISKWNEYIKYLQRELKLIN